MQLFKIDFIDENYLSIIPFVNSKEDKRKLMFTFRQAKYSQANKFGNEKLDLPKYATQILVKELRNIITPNIFHIESLLLDYIIANSCLFTLNDIESMYSAKTFQKVMKLQAIEKIVKSRAKITKTKLRHYLVEFDKDAICIKTAIIIAELRSLKLANSKGYPVKIYNRYLPIFDVYPEVGDFVAFELKHWLLKKIKVAQQLSKQEYNLTVGDLYKYFAIVNDTRLKSKRFSLLRDQE